MFAIGMLLCSCSSDQPETPVKERTVSLRLNAPDGLTRSGEGTTVNALSYAIYELNGDSRRIVEQSELYNVTFPYGIELKLMTGREYGVLFWADNQAALYTVDFETGEMTANYSDVSANNDMLDAFYAYKTVSVDGNAQVSVTMTRPFAMISIGASTKPADDSQSSITVNGVPTGINLFSGELSGNGTVDFGLAAVPQEPYPVDGYYSLAYTYVLAPAKTPNTASLSFTYQQADGSEASKTVDEVTLQANYRTNLYGPLPTNQQNK